MKQFKLKCLHSNPLGWNLLLFVSQCHCILCVGSCNPTGHGFQPDRYEDFHRFFSQRKDHMHENYVNLWKMERDGIHVCCFTGGVH